MPTYSFRLDENSSSDQPLIALLAASQDKTALIKDALDAIMRRDGERVKPRAIVDPAINAKLADLQANVAYLIQQSSGQGAKADKGLSVFERLYLQASVDRLLTGVDEVEALVNQIDAGAGVEEQSQ